MTSVDFPESNKNFGPPPDLTDGQCGTIRAYLGAAEGGSVDGCALVVTAWKPNSLELELLNQGRPLFLSFVGGLPPHFVCMSFQEATHPA